MTKTFPLPPKNIKLSSSQPNQKRNPVVLPRQRNLPTSPRLVLLVSQRINLIFHPSPTSPKCLPIWFLGQKSCLPWLTGWGDENYESRQCVRGLSLRFWRYA